MMPDFPSAGAFDVAEHLSERRPNNSVGKPGDGGAWRQPTTYSGRCWVLRADLNRRASEVEFGRNLRQPRCRHSHHAAQKTGIDPCIDRRRPEELPMVECC